MKPGSRSFLLIVCFLAPSPEPHGSHDVDMMDASQSPSGASWRVRHLNFTFQGAFSSFWQPDPMWHALLPEHFAAL